MATHSSILAWKIPWTEEPDRLQSMGSQRVGHGWATEHSTSEISGFSFLLFDSTLFFFFLFSSVFLPQVLLLTVLTNWNKNNYFLCLFCGWMVFVLVDTFMNNTGNIMGNKAGKIQWSPRNLFFHNVFSPLDFLCPFVSVI